MHEVRIGVVEVPKELILEIEGEAGEIMKNINTALGKDSGVLWLTDTKGKQVGIPIAKLAYVEIEPLTGVRSVGFGGG